MAKKIATFASHFDEHPPAFAIVVGRVVSEQNRVSLFMVYLKNIVGCSSTVVLEIRLLYVSTTLCTYYNLHSGLH